MDVAPIMGDTETVTVNILFLSYDEDLNIPEVNEFEAWTADLCDLQNAWRGRCFGSKVQDKIQPMQYTWCLLTLQTILDENPGRKLLIRNWTATAENRFHFIHHEVFYNYLTFIVASGTEYWLFGKEDGLIEWKQGVTAMRDQTSIWQLLQSMEEDRVKFDEKNKLIEPPNKRKKTPCMEWSSVWNERSTKPSLVSRHLKFMEEVPLVESIKTIIEDIPEVKQCAPKQVETTSAEAWTRYPADTFMVPEHMLQNRLQEGAEVDTQASSAMNLLVQAVSCGMPNITSHEWFSSKSFSLNHPARTSTPDEPAARYSRFRSPHRRLNSEGDGTTSMSESEDDESSGSSWEKSSEKIKEYFNLCKEKNQTIDENDDRIDEIWC